MFASSKGQGEKETANGIIQGHAYALVNVWEIETKESQNEKDIDKKEYIQLVELRNPWGSDKWKGNYCDGDEIWEQKFGSSQELKDKDDEKRTFQPDFKEKKDDGRFFMELDDYLKEFERTSVAYIRTSKEEAKLSRAITFTKK